MVEGAIWHNVLIIRGFRVVEGETYSYLNPFTGALLPSLLKLCLYLSETFEIYQSSVVLIFSFFRPGQNKNQWVKTEVSIGRRLQPFNLTFTGKIGSNWQGDIAIDQINFANCTRPGPCKDPIGKFT